MTPLVLLLSLTGLAQAGTPQEYGASLGPQPSPDEEHRTVTAGPRYRSGALHRTLFGAHYRELWTTPVTVPVLDLEGFAGGLTPVERGGGQQTRSLEMEGADGRSYVFRSLDKDPTPAVPPMFRGTMAHRLVQDAISAGFPGGPLVAAGLLRSAGVLHVTPTLVVMPDDPDLGEFRADFAGLLGYVEEKPGDGFRGSPEVTDSDELLDSLSASPAHQTDARAFLRARLMDQLMGDWDRHRDQWRWAATRQGERTVWRPIPRDRDQAFVRYDGLLLKLARQVHPKLVIFGPTYPSLIGLTWNGRDLDRRLLGGLDGAAFDSVAADLVARLSDAAIDSALDRLPEAFRGRWLEPTRAALIARRDELPAQTRRYYRQLATDIDVVGSGQPEWVEVVREADGGLTLTVRARPDGPALLRRRFLPDETREVRLYLGGGGDHLAIVGAARSGTVLRVIHDPAAVIDGADAPGVRVYLPEPARSTDTDDPIESGIAPRDWGGKSGVGPTAAYHADLGFLLGAQATRTDYSFRRQPYGSQVRLAAEYATAVDGFRIRLDGDLPQADSHHRVFARLTASQLEVVRFTGLGNETPAPAGTSAADVHQWRFTLAPAYEYSASEQVTLTAGPVVRYTTTSLDPAHLVGAERPRGSTGFGRVGMAAMLSAEAPDTLRPEPKARVEVGGSAFAPVWSARQSFGDVRADASLHLPLGGSMAPVLALRAGGKRVWGAFPYDEAAYLGGEGTVRGYLYQRFAGDAAVYGSAELRVPVAWVLRTWVPTQVGVLALTDAGRVWAEGTDSRRVHASAGGGLWLAFFDPRYAVSLTAASGREGTRWYLSTGLPY